MDQPVYFLSESMYFILCTSFFVSWFGHTLTHLENAESVHLCLIEFFQLWKVFTVIEKKRAARDKLMDFFTFMIEFTMSSLDLINVFFGSLRSLILMSRRYNAALKSFTAFVFFRNSFAIFIFSSSWCF